MNNNKLDLIGTLNKSHQKDCLGNSSGRKVNSTFLNNPFIKINRTTRQLKMGIKNNLTRIMMKILKLVDCKEGKNK